MEFSTRQYKELLNSGVPIEYEDKFMDRLFFNKEIRIGVLSAELFYLKKQVKRLPFLNELIQEKESFRSILLLNNKCHIQH